jgi:hypothetical protein
VDKYDQRPTTLLIDAHTSAEGVGDTSLDRHSSGFSTEAVTDHTTGAGAMPTVETFSRPMIEKFLKSWGLPYKADDDGDFILAVPNTDDMGCDLVMFITATGRQSDVCSMTALPTFSLPAARLTDALLACNEWNLEKRWPKAALKIGSSRDDGGTFMLEMSLDLEKGIHQELLSYTLGVFVSSAVAFCKWGHETKGFSGGSQERTRSTYGFTAEDPILCHQPVGEMQILNALRCPQGHRLRGDRQGSNRGKCTSPATHQTPFGDDASESCIVDVYDVKCDGGEYTSVLFFDMYHPSSPPQPTPQGLQRA